jgi:hypothetical protein
MKENMKENTLGVAGIVLFKYFFVEQKGSG